jgi:hypothetical protein
MATLIVTVIEIAFWFVMILTYSVNFSERSVRGSITFGHSACEDPNLLCELLSSKVCERNHHLRKFYPSPRSTNTSEKLEEPSPMSTHHQELSNSEGED